MFAHAVNHIIQFIVMQLFLVADYMAPLTGSYLYHLSPSSRKTAIDFSTAVPL